MESRLTNRHPLGEGQGSNNGNQRGSKRFPRQRFAFADELWFAIPMALYENGWAARLSSAEFQRYATMHRVSNKNHGAKIISASFPELRQMDGIAERTARHAHGKLAEYGLIEINRTTHPFSYRLVEPDEWRVPRIYPDPKTNTFFSNPEDLSNPWKRSTPT